MAKNAPFLIAAVCIAAFYPVRVLADGDVKAGQALFTDRCVACHSAHPTRKPGPSLEGLYGRPAGTVPNYAYSSALQNAPVIWNSETLDLWLTDPLIFMPGVNMQARVTDPQERQSIIAYLKSISSEGAMPGNGGANH